MSNLNTRVLLTKLGEKLTKDLIEWYNGLTAAEHAKFYSYSEDQIIEAFRANQAKLENCSTETETEVEVEYRSRIQKTESETETENRKQKGDTEVAKSFEGYGRGFQTSYDEDEFNELLDMLDDQDREYTIHYKSANDFYNKEMPDSEPVVFVEFSDEFYDKLLVGSDGTILKFVKRSNKWKSIAIQINGNDALVNRKRLKNGSLVRFKVGVIVYRAFFDMSYSDTRIMHSNRNQEDISIFNLHPATKEKGVGNARYKSVKPTPDKEEGGLTTEMASVYSVLGVKPTH